VDGWAGLGAGSGELGAEDGPPTSGDPTFGDEGWVWAELGAGSGELGADLPLKAKYPPIARTSTPAPMPAGISKGLPLDLPLREMDAAD